MEGQHHSKVSSQNGAEQERGTAQVVPRNHSVNSKKIRFLSFSYGESLWHQFTF